MNQAVQVIDHQGWALGRHEPAPDTGPERPFDVLFVHGMAAGSWVWTPEWLDRFGQKGYRSWTMTLPGREGGGTIGTDPGAFERAIGKALQSGDLGVAAEALASILPGAPLFDGPDLEDYTDALAEALAATGRPTVVVSHSLGGAVTQNLLRRGKRPAGTVLVCSAPPYGLWRASMEMAFTNLPLWKALLDFSLFGVAAADLVVLRQNLFPNGIEDRLFRKLMLRFTDESLAATSRTPGFPPFAPLPGPRSDMLVIGASEDRFVPRLDVHLTGLYYGTKPQIVEGAGHMPMFEPAHAGTTAGLILDWLETHGVRQGGRA